MDNTRHTNTERSSINLQFSLLWKHLLVAAFPYRLLNTLYSTLASVCVFDRWFQVTVPAAAELVQSGAADRVFRGTGQPSHGHREQHQVPGGLSHHPCPSSRLGWYTHTYSCMQILPAGNKIFDLHRHTPIQPLCFMLIGLLCPDLIFIEACLRCLRTVFISPVTPVQLLYTVGYFVHILSSKYISTSTIFDIPCLISKHTRCRVPLSICL